MKLASLFQPHPALSQQETARGLRLSIRQVMAGAGLDGLTSGGFLAAFALALGASNLQIGVLTALPFIGQTFQIPAVLLVERLGRRKVVAIPAYFLAQSVWIPIALVPVFLRVPSGAAVSALLGLMALRGMATAFINASWFTWLRDLVPQPALGRYFSRRQALATLATAVVAMSGALYLDVWKGQVPEERVVLGYTLAFLLGSVLLGWTSVGFMARMPEPQMQLPTGPRPSFGALLAAPVRDRNFRQLLNFLFFWNFAIHLAIPFFAVYMLQKLHVPLSIVIALSVLSQLCSILFARVWGPFADKFGSKVVLSLCSSLYLLVIVGWAFTGRPDPHLLTLPLLVVLHVFAGVASGGVSLTDMTLRMKLAPPERAAAYLSGASLAISLGAGLSPLLGGFLADFFSLRELSLSLHWTDLTWTAQLPVLRLAGFDFLFILAFVLGLITMNTLTTIREEGEVDRKVVLDQLMAEARDGFRSLSSVPGVGAMAHLPYDFLRRVPGMDVAMGVTAYQVAASIKTAAAAAARGGEVMEDIAGHVGQALSHVAGEAEELGEAGADLAHQAAREVMKAVNEVTDDVGELSRRAVVNVLNDLDRTAGDIQDAVSAAAYGAVLGAGDMGADVVQAATHAIAGAKEAALRLGLSEEDAAAQAVQGALLAAEILDPQAAARLKGALGAPPPGEANAPDAPLRDAIE